MMHERSRVELAKVHRRQFQGVTFQLAAGSCLGSPHMTHLSLLGKLLLNWQAEQLQEVEAHLRHVPITVISPHVEHGHMAH
mmetsp:Transcript_48400/g.87581  ORF Transcript_48400/g.87581 Transcript_48400/m.87581 type:complete len:81 (-) Transcript_48400:105-347(-)